MRESAITALMTTLILDFIRRGNHHGEVARSFNDRPSAPTWSRLESLEARPVVNADFAHDQLVLVDPLVLELIQQVVDSALDSDLDRTRGLLRQKVQCTQRITDALTAQCVDHRSHLPRRTPDVFTNRSCFHCLSQIDVERSEEHTSELQSRGHLVCRLLLEKKKTK